MCTVEVKTWDWTFPRETDAQFNSRGLSWQSHWHIVALVPHSQSWSVNFWMWFLALKYGCLMGQNDCVMSVICPLNMVRKGLALLFCIQSNWESTASLVTIWALRKQEHPPPRIILSYSSSPIAPLVLLFCCSCARLGGNDERKIWTKLYLGCASFFSFVFWCSWRLLLYSAPYT